MYVSQDQPNPSTLLRNQEITQLQELTQPWRNHPDPITPHNQPPVDNLNHLPTQSTASEQWVPPTPVKPDRLDLLLQGYDPAKRSYLVEGFRKGFSLESSSNYACQCSKNSKFVSHNPEIIWPFIQQELQANRFRGPFDSLPFNNMYLSPLGARPKRTPGSYRLIHDLSYPYDGERSVNDGIPASFSSVHYHTIADAIDYILELGPGTFLCKTDIQSAFRIVPVRLEDHHLLGFVYGGKYYYDTFLSMGCASSCRIFEEFSTALQWILVNKLKVPFSLHMVDDFLVMGRTFQQAKLALEILQEMCKFIGVPLAPNKTFGPATRLPFLGVDLCSVSMSAYIPLDKLVAYSKELLLLFDQQFTTKTQMRQIIGRLNWATSVVQGGRPFIRRFIDITMRVKHNFQKLKITKGIRQDALMWLRFLTSHQGKVMFLPHSWVMSDVINLQSDASPLAGAFVYGSQWLRIVYPPTWSNLNIACLEFYPILVGLAIFAHKLANHRIVFITDNMAVSHIINSQTSKDPILLQFIRQFVLLCLSNNKHFSSSYIESKSNYVPDFISRTQPSRTWLEAYGLSPYPVVVPHQWRPNVYKLECSK